jgi:hypothetical protein|nr:MAG TPA: hypothetical protein [Caudoviricetes sp.]
MFSIILIILIIFAAGLNNLFFTWIVKCDDGVFKYLLKTTFCLILSVTSILACTAIISNILAILLRWFWL